MSGNKKNNKDGAVILTRYLYEVFTEACQILQKLFTATDKLTHAPTYDIIN